MPTIAHRFEVTLTGTPPAGGTLAAGTRATIAGGAPPEFGGSAEPWSPEHLLVSAAALCFLTTTEWFARRAKLELQAFSCRAEGVVEKTPAGLAFTTIRLGVRATVPHGDAARAEALFATAKKHCLVSNSLRFPVELATEIQEAATPVAA
jgi:organic hydroperoxide reductase OsmC/OhrA